MRWVGLGLLRFSSPYAVILSIRLPPGGPLSIAMQAPPVLAGASGGEATAGEGALASETAGAALEPFRRALQRASAPLYRFLFRYSYQHTYFHAGLTLPATSRYKGRQERAPRLFGLTAAVTAVRSAKHLGGAMIPRDLRDHLAIMGRRSRTLRIEREMAGSFVSRALGEFPVVDFLPFRHPDY